MFGRTLNTPLILVLLNVCADFSTIKCLRYGLYKKEVVCLFIAFVEKCIVSIYTAEMFLLFQKLSLLSIFLYD